jgi:hypothetical protein
MSVYRVGTNKSSTNVFPSIRPTLDLDFANTKTLDPRITFTRASGGSYVGADGLIKYSGVNEARFDHDPETGESLGLLIEQDKTNLITRSEDLTTGWDLNGDVTVLGGNISPDGRDTAYLVKDSRSSSNLIGQNNLRKQLTSRPPGTYTLSFYAKSFISQSINLRTRFPDEDLTGPNGNNKLHVITNEWKRYYHEISHTKTTSGGGADRIIFYSGNEDFYIWGAQLEEGAFPTSYIPTQASTRTRAADNPKILGDNFKTFYNSNEFTMQCIFSKYFFSTVAPYPLTISSSNTSDTTVPSIRIRTDGSGNVQGQAIGDNGITVFNSNPSPITNLSINQVCNAAIAVKPGNTIYSDGGRISSPSNNIDTFNNVIAMHIGGSGSTGRRLQGHMRLVRYFPKRLPDQQLRALTR